jgi:hypothetical protein
MSTWLELSATLKPGDRVIFTSDCNHAKTGTQAKVIDNCLNEIWSTLILLPDPPFDPTNLQTWDGNLYLSQDPSLFGDTAPLQPI